MKIFTLIALAIGGVAVLFALQNPSTVTVTFFSWQVQESMALVLLGSFALGTIFGLLVSVPPMIGRVRKISHFKRISDEQSHQIEALNHQLNEANNRLTAQGSIPPTQDYPSSTAEIDRKPHW
jgi:uncharacterized integral membrane protein